MDVANLLAVLPHGGITAEAPIALRKLGGIPDQSPGPDVVAGLAGGPVVEDHLVEDEAAMLVVEVVHLNQIDEFATHVIWGRNAQANNRSADSDSYGTHQSPPCCR